MSSAKQTDCLNVAETLRRSACGEVCGNVRKSCGIAEKCQQVIDFACGEVLRKHLRRHFPELRKRPRNPLISLIAETLRNPPIGTVRRLRSACLPSASARPELGVDQVGVKRNTIAKSGLGNATVKIPHLCDVEASASEIGLRKFSAIATRRQQAGGGN